MFRNVGEGVTIALASLRENKLRSGLTILGVVIGVTTVMAIASMVQGIRTQIFNAIETAGPSVFYVMRFFSQTPLNPDRLPYAVRIRPVLATTDAEALARIPEIGYAGMWVQLFQRMEYQGTRTQTLTVFGADDHFMDIQGGTLLRGRFFTRGELAGAEVLVIEADVADRLFGRIDPLGRYVRVGGSRCSSSECTKSRATSSSRPGRRWAASCRSRQRDRTFVMTRRTVSSSR